MSYLDLYFIQGPLKEAGKASMVTNILAGRYHFQHTAFKRTSATAVQFVKALLHHDYRGRLRSHEVLQHPWLNKSAEEKAPPAIMKSSLSFRAVNNLVKNSEASELRRAGMVACVFGMQPTQVSGA